MYIMRAAAVVFAVILTLICLWWMLGYVARRSRGRRR
jgi:Na+-transporting methylmalonyl-CoA/oxaloacetate decarboxylase gamma subunit